MKLITFLLIILSSISYAQVGIGTTNPNLSAKLEIKSTDKGLLIPQINLNNVTTTQLDGTNTAATGLIIYNTNATITGGNGVGFYSFNGTTWEQLTFNSNNISTIPLWNSLQNINYTTGQDIPNYNSSIEPSIYNPEGKLKIKLIVRYSSSVGTSNLQLRTHNGTVGSFPITNTASDWTYASTQNGGIATSAWKFWDAGTSANEIHLFGWVNNSGDSLVVESAYLLVRSQ